MRNLRTLLWPALTVLALLPFAVGIAATPGCGGDGYDGCYCGYEYDPFCDCYIYRCPAYCKALAADPAYREVSDGENVYYVPADAPPAQVEDPQAW